MVNFPCALLAKLPIIRKGKLFSTVPTVPVILIVNVPKFLIAVSHYFTSIFPETTITLFRRAAMLSIIVIIYFPFPVVPRSKLILMRHFEYLIEKLEEHTEADSVAPASAELLEDWPIFQCLALTCKLN
jgi:hypothetical protein